LGGDVVKEGVGLPKESFWSRLVSPYCRFTVKPAVRPVIGVPSRLSAEKPLVLKPEGATFVPGAISQFTVTNSPMPNPSGFTRAILTVFVIGV
jgi:hypothetical protein